MPSQDQIVRLHRKYAPNDMVYNLIFDHCQIVSEIALWCAANIKDHRVDTELLKTAALLHDIGAYAFFNDEGVVTNMRPYRQHAILGAKILLDEGVDLRIAEAVETHVMMGLSKEEIEKNMLPLPARDYEPQTIEGELLCYADRFHTKLPVFNSYNTLMEHFNGQFPLQAEKFVHAAERFGIPDISKLASKWQHPVK